MTREFPGFSPVKYHPGRRSSASPTAGRFTIREEIARSLLHEFEDNEADETLVVTDEVASLATYLQMRVQNCRCRLVTS